MMARYHALKRITLKMRSSARLTVKRQFLICQSTRQVILNLSPNFLQVNQESLWRSHGYVDKIETLYTNSVLTKYELIEGLQLYITYWSSSFELLTHKVCQTHHIYWIIWWIWFSPDPFFNSLDMIWISSQRKMSVTICLYHCHATKPTVDFRGVSIIETSKFFNKQMLKSLSSSKFENCYLAYNLPIH